MGSLRLLRLSALAEAATLLVLLCLAVPLKYLADVPAATRVVGPVHGMAFLAFVWVIIQSLSAGEISARDAVRLLVGAFIPFGGVVNERWLATRGAPK